MINWGEYFHSLAAAAAAATATPICCRPSQVFAPIARRFRRPTKENMSRSLARSLVLSWPAEHSAGSCSSCRLAAHLSRPRLHLGRPRNLQQPPRLAGSRTVMIGPRELQRPLLASPHPFFRELTSCGAQIFQTALKVAHDLQPKTWAQLSCSARLGSARVHAVRLARLAAGCSQ